MSRSTSQASTITGHAASGLSRSLSLKTNTKAAQNINPLPPSDVRLFVTNLRLLDLDLRPDWPNITVQTFSSKNADQKQRIGGVEWSLFRLFEIWDPEETSQVRHTTMCHNVSKPNPSPETPAVLPTPRTAPIAQPPRRPISMS